MDMLEVAFSRCSQPTNTLLPTSVLLNCIIWVLMIGWYGGSSGASASHLTKPVGVNLSVNNGNSINVIRQRSTELRWDMSSEDEPCEASLPGRDVYTKYETSCPPNSSLTSTLFFQQQTVFMMPVAPPYKVTWYFRRVNETLMKCQTKCSDSNTTVITSATVLREVLRTISTTASTSTSHQLPWCEMGEGGEGHWVARELWTEDVLPFPENFTDQEGLSNKRDNESRRCGSSITCQRARVLRHFVSGDVYSGLSWPHLWLPSKCRTFRYNITTLLRCADRWKARHKSILHIVFLGDSMTRGTFCGLLRLLSAGGECSGAFERAPCFPLVPINATIIPDNLNILLQFTYSCRGNDYPNFKISFQRTYSADDPMLDSILKGLVTGQDPPTHIIYNSGAWDYLATLKRPSGKSRTSSAKHSKRTGKKLKYKTDRIWSYVVPPPWARSTINHDFVNRNRPGLVTLRLLLLQQLGYKGQFVYRSNVCNAVFEPRGADAGVEAVVRDFAGRLGHERFAVLNMYQASLCRGTELMKDHLHFSREFTRRPPKGKPSMGELNYLIIHSMLNGVCNPVTVMTE